jgi:peptide/nickel transport system substrate-binding protein
MAIQRTARAFVVLLTAGTLLLAGCASRPVDQTAAVGSEPAKQGQTTASSPKQGGVLKVGVTADAVGFDPHLVDAYSSGLVIEQVYNGLLKLDDKMQVQPDLAETWDVAPDGLSYTFKLRQGVKFHNGRELKAADVQYSLGRVKDPKSPRAYLIEAVKSVDVVNDYTVKLTLDKPFAPLLTNLASALMAIVPQETVAKNGDLQKVADGTGPFILKDYVPGQMIKLERNPSYFVKGQPMLDGIEIKPMPDDTARVTAIRTGEIDLAIQLPAKDISTLKADKSVVLVGGPSTAYDYIGINTTRKPFNDVKVRQAMAYALDRQAIVDTALFGEGTVIKTGPVPPGHWAYLDSAAYQPDLTKAKQLLAEAGYPNGFKATVKVGSAYQSQIAIAQVVQAQLKQVGITIDVKPMDWGLFLDEAVNKHDFDLTILGWIGFVDPDGFLYPEFKTGEKWNYVQFSDPTLDAMLEKGRTTLDANQRKQIYADVQKRVADQAPYVFIELQNQYEGSRPYVQGFYHMATGSMQAFHQVWLDK